MSWRRRCTGVMLALGAVMLLSAGTVGLLAPPAAAAAVSPDKHCNAYILGVPAWYNGIIAKDPTTGKCGAIVSPSAFGDNGLRIFIFKIILNAITVLLFAAGYVCVIFVIYGGFKYFFSTGSSDGMSKAKQTILNALIGLVISMLAVGIVNAVAGIV